MRSLLFAGTALVATLTLAPAASAWEPGVHDGLHIRGALGVGYAGDAFESEAILGAELDDSLGGLAIAGELSAGYGVVPGVFVGAGYYFNHVPSPKAKDIDWVFDIDEAEFDQGYYTMLGPMIDVYPDPADGLHLTLALGWGFFGLGDGEALAELGGASIPLADQKGGGVSGMLGVGYDFWVADVLSLGVLGRFMVARATAEDDNDVDWKHTLYSPALLFSASFD